MRKRTICIIDAQYALRQSRKHKFDLDLRGLKACLDGRLGDQEGIGQTYFFDTMPESGDEGVKRFHYWLKSAEPKGPRFQVKLYPLKTTSWKCDCGKECIKKVQKGVDVAIATLMLTLQSSYDSLILVAGDGDFMEAIEYLKNVSGKEIIIAGFKNSVSHDLQCFADQIVWLDEQKGEISRQRKTQVA